MNGKNQQPMYQIIATYTLSDRQDVVRAQLGNQPLHIGSGERATLRLDSGAIEPIHMRVLSTANGDVIVTNLGKNDTVWLDNKPLRSYVPTPWQPGTSVRIEPYNLQLISRIVEDKPANILEDEDQSDTAEFPDAGDVLHPDAMHDVPLQRRGRGTVFLSDDEDQSDTAEFPDAGDVLHPDAMHDVPLQRRGRGTVFLSDDEDQSDTAEFPDAGDFIHPDALNDVPLQQYGSGTVVLAELNELTAPAQNGDNTTNFDDTLDEEQIAALNHSEIKATASPPMPTLDDTGTIDFSKHDEGTVHDATVNVANHDAEIVDNQIAEIKYSQPDEQFIRTPLKPVDDDMLAQIHPVTDGWQHSRSLSAQLNLNPLRIAAGERVRVPISVKNHHDKPLHIRLITASITQSWLELPTNQIEVAPGETRSIDFIVHTPATISDKTADILIRLTDGKKTADSLALKQQIIFETAPDITGYLQPLETRNAEMRHLCLQNHTQRNLGLFITYQLDTDDIFLTPAQPQLDLPAGQFISIPLPVELRRRPLFFPAHHAFSMVVLYNSHAPLDFPGTLVVSPRIRLRHIWLFLAAALIFAILLVGSRINTTLSIPSTATEVVPTLTATPSPIGMPTLTSVPSLTDVPTLTAEPAAIILEPDPTLTPKPTDIPDTPTPSPIADIGIISTPTTEN